MVSVFQFENEIMNVTVYLEFLYSFVERTSLECCAQSINKSFSF
jgi:hypothetical protein